MACWRSSCIFPMPFLVTHFTKVTALSFLEWTAISIALSRLINYHENFLSSQGVRSHQRPPFLTGGRLSAMKTPWSYLLYSLCLGTFLCQTFSTKADFDHRKAFQLLLQVLFETIQGSSLLNFGPGWGHFWSVGRCWPIFLCQHRASILAFCSKISQQCIKDFTIMV